MIHDFKPAWWLKNPHLQTLWPTLIPRRIKIQPSWERIILPDSDFIDLAWVGENRINCPIILILHGLGGSLYSPYAKGLLHSIKKQGWRGVLMHFRGCSGMPNKLPRSYHSGETEDLSYIVSKIKEKEPHTPLYAVGYSLGGNVLLKWLGETQTKNPLAAAVAISVPFELHKSSDCLNKGFSKLYQWHLIKGLVSNNQKKFKLISSPIDIKNIDKINTFVEFDEAVTAPLHGFKNAEEYYRLSSSRQFLAKIERPTLILHSIDDPFTRLDALPTEQEVSKSVELQYTKHGGHVGFVGGNFPWKPQYWLEQRIINFLSGFNRV